MLIVSKQNIKLFPADFFIDGSKKEEKELNDKEIKAKSNTFKVNENLFKQNADFTFNPKLITKPEENKHLYFDFHDEDKELLDMLKLKKLKEGIISI